MKDNSGKQATQDVERYWLENVYKADVMRQATPRAIIMGMLLGGFMSLSNLYVGLKTGWGLGVAITSCILAYAIYASLYKAFPRLFKNEFSILENNAMQSAASAAGYMTSAGLTSAIPALMMLNPYAVPPTWLLFFWIIFISSLGVVMAIPMKRQMINIEQLKFPSGIAAAETLKSLHSTGEEAMKKAASLGIAGLAGCVVTWFRDAHARWMPFNIPSTFAPSISISGIPLIKLTLAFEGSLIMVAAGAIMGFRVAWSMLLGALINYGVIAPPLINADIIHGTGYRAIVSWSLWCGTALMVTSGLLLFFMQWKTIIKAFSGISAIFGKKPSSDDPLERVEVPGSWFVSGILIAGGGCIFLQTYFFHIKWWMAILSVLLTFLLVVVACRATGETDTTPTGAMGKITQLTFGLISPGNITTNLMTANVTAGSASHAADLLTDLKSGYLLGANPRQQFFAQFFGVLAGASVVVPAFHFLIPDTSKIGSDQFPAPAAQVWKGVAELLAQGLSSLHPTARLGLLIGAIIGIILPLLERAFPRYKRFIPSATGLGLSLVIPAWNTVSMFIGALIALILEKTKPATAGTYVIPVSSGLIAGESLMGVTISLLVVSNILNP